jgi:hypothetical protein
MHDSFGGARPFVEVQDELIAAGHEVVVDDAGFGALFLRAEDCEGLLTSRRFGAVAMPILYLSGIFDGPLYDLWSVLMFGKDGDEHPAHSQRRRRLLHPERRGAVPAGSSPSALGPTTASGLTWPSSLSPPLSRPWPAGPPAPTRRIRTRGALGRQPLLRR